jgi:hypothetical protein
VDPGPEVIILILLASSEALLKPIDGINRVPLKDL